MKFIAAITSSACLLWSSACFAYYVDGNTLVSDMRQWQMVARDQTRTDFVKAARYSSYIFGVYDALSFAHVVCASNDTDAGAVATVVAKYLQAHPQRWDGPAFDLVSEALIDAYSCKEK